MARAPGLLICCSLLAGIAAHSAIRAQEPPAGYPARPIRLITSSVPGGGLDIICRSVGQMLTERLGQSVIVDRRQQAGREYRPCDRPCSQGRARRS